MDILFYNGSLRLGGAEKILAEILKGLDKKNKNIDLLISDENEDENFFESELPKEVNLKYLISKETIKKTIQYKNKKKSFIFKCIYNFYMLKEQREKRKNLEKYLKNKNYDVTVDFDMGLSKNIDLVSSNLKIAWIHSPIDRWYKKKNKIKRLGNRLKKYDILVTICDEMKEETKKLYPFLKEKIVRIYNPFDINDIIKKSLDKDGLSELELKLLEEKFFISVGRLDNYSKDYYTLLKGYKKALENGIKEKLYILGDGPERRQIEDWISELNLKEKVVLLGKKRNPYVWIKTAKLFIHSSRFEGLPTVLIESLICETPIISSDCKTGPKEILENGEYGKLYEIGDFEKLSELIMELVNSEKEYKKIRENSLKRGENFSKEKIIIQIENLLKGIKTY